MSDPNTGAIWLTHKANVEHPRSFGATDRELYEMRASIDLEDAQKAMDEAAQKVTE